MLQKVSATGKTSLRRYQFELAKKGNATMLIWLGKQYLGQSEKPVVEEPDVEVNWDQLPKEFFEGLTEAAVRKRASEESGSA